MKPLFNWLTPFKPKTPSTTAHLSPVQTQPNQLLNQSISDQNLDDALAWLQKTTKDQDNSDVWHYSKHWQQHKTQLQQRIQNGSFTFQTVKDAQSKNKDGKTEHREIRCVEDRLLIRAISQSLKPIFEQSIAPECTHLSGRGGTKAPVEDSHAQLLKQPNAHVMKSDIKGYYAHIDHFILHTQFCTLLPQEIKLQRLLWMFLQRTVERGGNYREIEKGIPLGSSISPLLGALYLSPLDALFSQDDKHFYRRYMDDWVIFCKNKWDLRNTVKHVYAVLQSLRVDVAPKKTYIGKASKGFDFLGKRILPIGILPSAAALSRMQRNTVRFYEQGASKKRIGLYWMRWLCWAVPLVLASPGHVGVCTAASPGAGAGTGGFCSCGDATGQNFNSIIIRHVTATEVSAAGDLSIAFQATPTTANNTAGIHVFTNTSSGAGGQQYQCFWTVGVGYSNAQLVVATPPEIDVFGLSPTHIVDGGTDDFGTVPTGVSGSARYTVANTGDAALSITNVTATPSTNVTIGTISSTAFTVAAGGTTTFDVSYTPTADGAFSFELDITNDDSDEGDYDITVSGTAATASSGGGDDTTTEETITEETTTEPTDQPTEIEVTGNGDEGSIKVSWSGSDEVSSYAVLCNTTGIFSDPDDGSSFSDDPNCADGSGVLNIGSGSQASATPQGLFAQSIASLSNFNAWSLVGISTLQAATTTQSSTWSGLTADTTYYFKIFPYNGSGSSVDYKVDGTPLEANATTGGVSVATNKGVFGGEKVTPSAYKVTVSKVEFKNAQGEFVTLADDGTSFDVASVSANSSVGTFGKTAVLPNGTYSEIRLTLAGNFAITASGSDKGSSCRTNSSGSTGSIANSLTNVAIGSSDGSSATLQQISYPGGSAASSALSTAGFSQSGSDLQVTASTSFSVSDNSIPPSIAINIDVTGAVEVLTSGGNCNVLPQPPSVNVTVDG